jgi:hypothetical protein
MNTKINTKGHELVKETVNVGEETSKVALGIGIALAALVGLWGTACLIGGLASSGILDTGAGYIKAVLGI